MVEIMLVMPGNDAVTRLYALDSIDYVRFEIAQAVDGDRNFATFDPVSGNGKIYISANILTSFIVIVREIEEISKKQAVL